MMETVPKMTQMILKKLTLMVKMVNFSVMYMLP